MKYNISTIDNSIREHIYKVRDRLHLELDDATGKIIRVQKGEKAMLDVKPDEVNITYVKKYEVFYALKCLLASNKKAFTLPIECAFSRFGVMLDCSRNAVPNVEFLKDYILNLVLMGYNEIQLYTEDTYEVEGEPFFGYMRGRYSAAEIREIVAFAEAFEVDVVPCIQTLAHLNQIFRWKKYRDICDIDDIMLVDDDRTYELIDNMITSIAKVFKCRRIHIGMDEAHNVGRGKFLDLHGNENKTKILVRHLNKVVEICKRNGFTPMMWSDMFFRINNGGQYHLNEGVEFNVTPETLAAIPADLELVYWDYYHELQADYDRQFKAHAKFENNKTVFGGGLWRWIGFVPQNAISIARTSEAIAAAKDNNVESFFLTMWGDDGSECAWNSLLPSLCCVSDLAYGESNHDSSFAALTGLNYNDFMAVDLPDGLRTGMSNISKIALYNDYFLGIYDEAIKHDDAVRFKEIAARLHKVEKQSGRYAYVFKTLACMCDVLAIKATLGKQTREAYNKVKTSENVIEIKKQIKKMIGKSYKPLVDKLEKFYDAYRTQWYKENKPFGFEIMDMRLGGLIQRTKHCIYELERYVKGEIQVIPELEERQLMPDGCTLDSAFVNGYGRLISAGKLSW